MDVDLCRKFMEYLLNAPQTIHTNQKLHINSAAGYWSAFRAVLHTAYRDRKIKENPNGFLDRIESIPTMRASEPGGTDTACRNAMRGRGSEKSFPFRLPDGIAEERHQAAYLAADTAVYQRQDVRDHPYAEDEADCTQPISDEAYGLLGERHEGLIFEGFKDKMLQGPEALAVGGRHNQEDNLPLYPAFIRKPARGNGHGHGCHTSLSGTQEHYHHTNLFQDGCTTDVRGGGQDNPETQGSIGLVSGYSGGAVIACRL